MFLHVDLCYSPAVRLYESLGYEPVSDDPVYEVRELYRWNHTSVARRKYSLPGDKLLNKWTSTWWRWIPGCNHLKCEVRTSVTHCVVSCYLRPWWHLFETIMASWVWLLLFNLMMFSSGEHVSSLSNFFSQRECHTTDQRLLQVLLPCSYSHKGRLYPWIRVLITGRQLVPPFTLFLRESPRGNVRSMALFAVQRWTAPTVHEEGTAVKAWCPWNSWTVLRLERAKVCVSCRGPSPCAYLLPTEEYLIHHDVRLGRQADTIDSNCHKLNSLSSECVSVIYQEGCTISIRPRGWSSRAGCCVGSRIVLRSTFFCVVGWVLRHCFVLSVVYSFSFRHPAVPISTIVKEMMNISSRGGQDQCRGSPRLSWFIFKYSWGATATCECLQLLVREILTSAATLHFCLLAG